ncbi:hypothetical protein [Nonomuraea sediminis]|uniref:hypothetical protein n=1 Tax=Nonomuraea sediminis TaxID=2835864 RepID=UPI001BDD9CC0|nr:hypothetical protein [Nonomuraea sediminis]
MGDISYLQAWQMWLDGKSTLGSTLWGVPMIWWGRAGKILTFLSGAVVIIDLVGVERLSRYGDRLVRLMAAHGSLPFIAGLFAGVIAGWLTVAATASMGTDSQLRSWLVIVVGGAAGGFTTMIGFALQHRRFASMARWVSLGLLLIGFHFDLLAS